MTIDRVTPENYREALIRIETLFDAAPGTPEYDELDRLATLVNDYEDKHYPTNDTSRSDDGGARKATISTI